MSTHDIEYQPGYFGFTGEGGHETWCVIVPDGTTARCGGHDYPNLKAALNAALMTGGLVECGELKMQICGTEAAPMLLCFHNEHRAKVYLYALAAFLGDA